MIKELTGDEWFSMYQAQCAATDEWAAKYRAEVERKADATLLARCAELESVAANANALVTAANERLARMEWLRQQIGVLQIYRNDEIVFELRGEFDPVNGFFYDKLDKAMRDAALK